MPVGLAGTGKEAAGGRHGPEEPGRELAAVTDALRAAVARLLREDGASPRLVARLLARVAGELGAEAVPEDGPRVEAVLDGLADAMRRAGRERLALVRPAGEARDRALRGGSRARGARLSPCEKEGIPAPRRGHTGEGR